MPDRLNRTTSETPDGSRAPRAGGSGGRSNATRHGFVLVAVLVIGFLVTLGLANC